MGKSYFNIARTHRKDDQSKSQELAQLFIVVFFKLLLNHNMMS